jgi:hypothetical protein
MARLVAKSIGWCYPTPLPLLPSIMSFIDVPMGYRTIAVVDPCAADGTAVREVCRAITQRAEEVDGACARIDLFACELETKRFEILRELKSDNFKDSSYPHEHRSHHIIHGDALKVVWNTDWDGASMLFLNPPYEEKALEFEFTQRYIQCLGDGGILVLIVPYKSLDRLAPVLAQWCDEIACYRFPENFFKSFGQVVVFAKKRVPLAEPNQVAMDKLMAWWRDPTTAPELPERAPSRPYKIPALSNPGFYRWAVASVDVPRMLAQVKPWHFTDRGGKLRQIPGIAPIRPVEELLERRYLLAMPPKQAHIAGALASGVFNGAVVKPNDPNVGLPNLLVNGAFSKQYRHLEDKVDAEGEKKGEVRVESPRLVITVLDLDKLEFYTLANEPTPSGVKDVAKMNAADFIEFYGLGLLNVMRKQCPVVHDPSDPTHEIALPSSPSPLYKVQRHAVMALVKLLGGPDVSPTRRRGLCAGLDGEPGTGKTRMGAMVARACGAKRVLVMCPTHLLTTWPEEIPAIDANAKIMELNDVADVDRFFSDKHDGMIFGIVSKETAKLSHKWADIGALSPKFRKMCPRCGAAIAVREEGELSAKRARCSAQAITPSNETARWCQRLALFFLPFSYHLPDMWTVLAGRNLRRYVDMVSARFGKMDEAERKAARAKLWDQVRSDERYAKTIRSFTRALIRGKRQLDRELAGDCLAWLLHGQDNLDTTMDACRKVYSASLETLDGEDGGRSEGLRQWVREVLLRVDFDRADVEKFVLDLREMNDVDVIAEHERSHYGRGSYTVERNAWSVWERSARSIRQGAIVNDVRWHGVMKQGDMAIRGRKTREWDELLAGSMECTLRVIARLYKNARFGMDVKCGEPLFQAIPDPRRYPLANFISAQYPHDFDFLIVDEVHEMKGDGTAQSFAFHRLAACGAPSLFLTGTWMNGKAESLFNVQWAMDPEFRQTFGFNDRSKFKETYGYKKVEVSYRDCETRKIVEYGTASDRVEIITRDVGDAPGVLPLFLPRFLLRRVVVVHKSELDNELPPCREHFEIIECDSDQLAAHKRATTKVIEQLRRDKRTAKAGQLLGALWEIQSQPDRCTDDTGNMPDGGYEIRYPEEGRRGRAKRRKRGEAPTGELLMRLDPFPASRIMPKEARMLELVQEQLARGRGCMVFGWHKCVLPRLARLLREHIGEQVALLEADRVDPYKRKDWINKNVIAKGIRLPVVSPPAVMTGLNNLIAFPTQIWCANPNCNPTIVRQTRDRSHRIGQTRDVEIYHLLYKDTAQAPAHKLLMTKVGVSMSTDGLDARSVLMAAGIGESDTFDLLSVGKQLYELMAA